VIDSYRFGEIVIDGKKYRSDVVIYPDRVNDSWWRLEGHRLQVRDLGDVLAESPDVVIIGTGAYGMMKVEPEVLELFDRHDIPVHVEKTEKACLTYNCSCQLKRAVAFLHLTC